MPRGTYYIGTSGWAYKDWDKSFYPKDLPATKQLSYLAEHFRTAELNASFYRLPLKKTYQKWYGDTPDDFVFAVKVSRYITHIKRLKGVRASWQKFRRRTIPLGEKMSVFLVQLPPSFSATEVTLRRLDGFLKGVRKDNPNERIAFEFRHPTWFERQNLRVLEEHGAALVFAESSRFPHSPLDFAPTDFVYFRFHGPRKLYSSPYRDDELAYWAKAMKEHAAAGRDVYAYFDNDVHGYALKDAQKIKKILKVSR